MLKEILGNKKIIDIDLAPNWDMVFTGYCMAVNDEIILMLNYNEELFEFDGYSIYKNDDVSKYRVWEQDEYKDVKFEESEEWISKINIDQFTNLVSSLESLKGELVGVNTYGELEGYYVGEVISVTKSILELRLISEGSEWLDVELFELSEISCFGFGTSYEVELLNNVSKSI